MAKTIILIHGLGGTNDGTWGNFPALLRGDIDLQYDVEPIGYPSPMPEVLKPWTYPKLFSRAPSILNIANGVLTDIEARCDLENDEIVLAGHSLGGVILKKVLLLIKNRKIPNNIGKVCFFDVPHDGSGYANACKNIAFRNRHLKSLTRDSSEADDLNEQWISSGLNNELEILSIIAANDDIVSSLSSKSIFREHAVKTINNTNHKTIVKPENSDSLVYVVFKEFLLKKTTVGRFKTAASRDLRDWRRIEGDRKHSYRYSTDEKRDNDLKALVDTLKLDHTVVRLTGASGLGKTRLLLEALDTVDVDYESCSLVIDAPSNESDIKRTIKAIVDDNAHGLVIVENCSVDLHNHLAREANKAECFLKLVTIGYSDDQVDQSIHIQLSPLSLDAIKEILTPILVGLKPSDVERVARFAEGYPLMATLIAEQYQREGRLLGSIETDSVVKKLIDGDGGTTEKEKNILSACSLFDVFGTRDGAAGVEATFIAEDIARSDRTTFDQTLIKFSGRQIINRAGRYARLVPKPLALTLAAEWWDVTDNDRKKEIIDKLPDSLLQSFCTQSAYLDNKPSVQNFSDRLFGGARPFVQAEELLTERGSKLFRAFVEVNPKSTSDALFNVLSKSNFEQLQAIQGDTRRNLVWSLEMLCFRADTFEKSAWCLLLLASAENETWNNNATGIFAQLFRVHLSGTQANPEVRFDLLKRAIELDQENIDMVVLEALSEAISTHGSSRTLGAEFQGTSAPLEEWRPNVWQDIFDFWQQAFDLILVVMSRGEKQQDRGLAEIGHSIRGFVARNRIEMLDTVVREVISKNGRYWPSALESINHTLEYDSDGMSSDTSDVLHTWLDLLNPDDADLSERLKIIVTNPPWEHKNNEQGSYVDIAAEKAKALAIELAPNIDQLTPQIDLLLRGSQRQAYPFGYQLSHELSDVEPFIDMLLDRLALIESPDYSLLRGVYRGLFEKAPEAWERNITRLSAEERFFDLYPDFIRTGDIREGHLETLLAMITSGDLLPLSADLLSYGSVTDNLEPGAIGHFCIALSELGDQGSWTALNVIYMYCFQNKNNVAALRDQIRQIVCSVPIHMSQEINRTELHQWKDLVEKLTCSSDTELAAKIARQLVAACKHRLDHGDIWHYIKPLLTSLMSEYADTIWPIFGDAVVHAEAEERYWLQQLLDRENGLASNMPSVLSVMPVETIINWCSRAPDVGPVFVARCLNIFDDEQGKKTPSALFIAVLEIFGEDQSVASELSANMGTRGWSGSLVPYLEADKVALSTLIDHKSPNVRRWVKDHINYINRKIDFESQSDEEQSLGRY